MLYLIFGTTELEGVHLKHSMKVPKGQRGRAGTHTFPGESAGLAASLKCLYTNTHSMDNKCDELEICVQLQGYGLPGITGTWWDSSHDWSAEMEGCRSFRKNRLGRWGRGVTFSVREQQKCTKLCLGVDDEHAEN